MWCKCGNKLPQVRVDYGYKKCVQCSDTEQVSYVPIITHKTGSYINKVQKYDDYQKWAEKNIY